MYKGRTWRNINKIKNEKKKKIIDEIANEVWKRKNGDKLLRLSTEIYKENPIEKWKLSCILILPKKGDFGIIKNCRILNLNAIAAKVYNKLFFIPKMREMRRNFEWIDPWPHWTDDPSYHERSRAKNLMATPVFVAFSKAWSHSFARTFMVSHISMKY